MGGEKSKPNPVGELQIGSPPRGRGKAPSGRGLPQEYRITPAWAGKSLIHPHGSRWHRDHPRVGGEKARRSALDSPAAGSPPRGRGKDDDEHHPAPNDRITPAWAGKRLPPRHTCCPSWDHPRVGGEKAALNTLFNQWAGITPAWAGKSGWHCTYRRNQWDHPRVGGEK